MSISWKMAFQKHLFCLLRPAFVGLSTKTSEKHYCLFTLKYATKQNKYINEFSITPIIYKRFLSKSTSIESAKEEIILKLNFENSEHARPFYKLPINTLLHIYKVTKNDEKHGYCKNRLYYIASRLKCPPWLISKVIADRTFIYGLSFDWLEKSLNVLLDMGVSSDRILRDLWVLKYNSDTIRERLQQVKNMGVEQMYPWMVRCSDNILNRYVSIMQETKDILGENKSTQIYLAKRLDTTVENVNDMCSRIPALKTIRVTKAKHFLDFLLSEGFTVEDIISKPRILSASQKTVKQRIDKLRQLGLNEINLNVLCRSKKGFKRFYESFESENKDVT